MWCFAVWFKNTTSEINTNKYKNSKASNDP